MSDDEIQPFAGWDENGVWIVAGIDQYGNIVPLPATTKGGRWRSEVHEIDGLTTGKAAE